MISIPIAVHNENFHWQLDLFWFAHRRVYGFDAPAHAVIIKRNDPSTPKREHLEWQSTIPHTMCEAFFDVPVTSFTGVASPLNIQVGLSQVLSQFPDDAILEVIDCDMFHFRPCPLTDVADNEIIVSSVYEDWHLFSLSSNRHVVAPYFENEGRYYNGGFVPIIAKASTFRKLLPEWINVHIDILKRPHSELIHWWAGMYALQAACEKARVQMVARDCCYVSGINQLSSEQHIGHYCCDRAFDKKTYPRIDPNRFADNCFYNIIKEWLVK